MTKIKKLKIAHVNMFYLPTIGGVEKVIYELAKRQVAEGHEVHVFCCDSNKEKRIGLKEEIIDGVHVHRLPYWFRLSFNTFIWPSLLWNFKGNFDIVHTHVSGHAYIMIMGLLSKLKGVNHIHTTHCPWTDTSFRPFILRPFLFLNNLIFNKWSFRFIDKVISITPWELDILSKYVKDKNKIVVIQNGTDNIFFNEIKENDFKKKHKIGEKNLVLFFGRLNPTKGPEKLALVAREISKKRSDIAFVWVGPDEGKAWEVKRLIRGYKNMKYLGAIRDKNETAKMYRAADVYVLPSYREGLPLTLFEAMASGLPIVASPVNGIPFEMETKKNGFFSDYGDLRSLEENILKLIDNVSLRKKIASNNIKKAQNYRWDNIYLKYMKEYYSLTNKK
jgi:glycosyltransferase involved in cell wall biosynthesis